MQDVKDIQTPGNYNVPRITDAQKKARKKHMTPEAIRKAFSESKTKTAHVHHPSTKRCRVCKERIYKDQQYRAARGLVMHETCFQGAD